MRWSRAFVVTACAALLAGCGNRHLVLNVDVLSYLDPSLTQVEFGPVPAIPGGIYTGEQALVADKQINLLGGTGSVAEVQGISISMAALAEDSTGAGADTLRLYLSDIDTDPMTTAPVMMLPIVLTPGVTDTVSVDVGGDSRVADLFTQKNVRLTLTTAMRGPDTGQDLNARIRLLALEAVLVAGRKTDL